MLKDKKMGNYCIDKRENFYTFAWFGKCLVVDKYDYGWVIQEGSDMFHFDDLYEALDWVSMGEDVKTV